MSSILAIALKDIRLLLRDKAGLFFTFFLPLMFAVFFGVISSGFASGPARALDLAVVDEDGTDASRRFIERLEEGDEFDVSPASDRDSAADLVRRGRRTAFVVLPRGFGEASQRMFWGDPMTVVIGVDPARTAEAGMIQGLVTARAYERMQTLFTDPAALRDLSRRAIDSVRADSAMAPGVRAVLESFLSSLGTFADGLPALTGAGSGPGASFEPVRIETAPITRERTNAYAITFPQGIVWGVIGAAAGFGISLVVERTRGTLVRLCTAPIERWKILAGKGLACFLTIVFLATVLMIIARIVFGVRPGSVPLLALAIICSAIGFVGIMMLLSMFRTEAAAGGGGWAILLVFAMIGGAMVPLRFMPGVLQTISHASPVKWCVFAIEGAVWRDLTFAQMLLPCAILVGIGVAGFAIGARAFRWST